MCRKFRFLTGDIAAGIDDKRADFVDCVRQ